MISRSKFHTNSWARDWRAIFRLINDRRISIGTPQSIADEVAPFDGMVLDEIGCNNCAGFPVEEPHFLDQDIAFEYELIKIARPGFGVRSRAGRLCRFGDRSNVRGGAHNLASGSSLCQASSREE